MTDKFGGILALTCAIHCMLMPVLIGVGGFLFHGVIEVFFLVTAIGFTILSLYQINKKGLLRPRSAVLLISGIILVLLSLVLHVHTFSAIGGVFLALGHYFNYKITHTCSIEHKSATAHPEQ